MSVLKYFKNIPRSPPIGRHVLSVIFFLQICNEVPGRGRAGAGRLSPPPGDGPPLGRPVGPARGCGWGACRPPRATGVTSPI